MELLKEGRGRKIPILQEIVVINNIFWELQKINDGYNIYTDFPLPNKPMKGIRCCIYIDIDPKLPKDDIILLLAPLQFQQYRFQI